MSMGVKETTPTARKYHKCQECRRLILPGEAYHRISGMYLHEGANIVDQKFCRLCDLWGKVEILVENAGGWHVLRGGCDE